MKKILTTVGITLIALSTLTTSSFAVGDPRATGDLIAHELNTPGLGWAGHVGIWDNSRKRVLEVLNQRKAISTTRTLSQFKRASRKYWGARYGRGWSHYRVINAGREQAKWSPKYTRSSSYVKGGYRTKWKWSLWRGWYIVKYKVDARFRCDSFVSYSYEKGIGLKLIPWYVSMTPKNIFYSMPYAR